MTPIMITGAAGFLGRHIVAAARARGHPVVAVIRTPSSVPEDWVADRDIRTLACDMATASAPETLGSGLAGCGAVIHAAARMSGGDADHARDTGTATQNLLTAIAAQGKPKPRLMLVSSIAVYDYSSVAAGEKIDETTPLESNPDDRDSYCRGKLAQEQCVRGFCRQNDLPLTIARPGAVFGPGRLWNSHIGPGIGPAVIRLSGTGEVPVTYVRHCADVLVQATFSDIPGGIVNIIDPPCPARDAFLAAHRESGWPRIILPLPWRLLDVVAGCAEVSGLSRNMPGLLRRATLHARIKPVRFSADVLRDQVGWAPALSFAQAMKAAIKEENNDHG